MAELGIAKKGMPISKKVASDASLNRHLYPAMAFNLEGLKEKACSFAAGFKNNDRRLAFAQTFLFSVVCRFWEAIQNRQPVDLKWPIFMPSSLSPGLIGQFSLNKGQQELARMAGNAAADLDRLEAGYMIGCLYTALIPDDVRSRLGVYYTPPALTKRLLDIAEKAGADWSNHKVLDPACGGGAFLAPLAKRMIEALASAKEAGELIHHLVTHLHGFEIDPFGAWLSHVLLESTIIELCYAADQRLPLLVTVKDTLSEDPKQADYDVIVGNPPYGKIRLTDEERARFKRSLYGHANLYGLFTDQALKHLREGGVVAYVTPTSFLAGNYFKELRKLLVRQARPFIIDFVSARSRIFENVLQETLLLACKKSGRHETGTAHVLQVSNSSKLQVIPVGRFSLPKDDSAPWIIPRSPDQSQMVRRFSAMNHRLRDYGYKVSTGPLVWNRHKSQLREESGPNRYPLIWAEAVTPEGRFVFRAQRKNHQPFFEPRPHEVWVLVKQPCVLLQRTTAKEQNRRLIAAELPSDFLKEHKAVVIENHLNMVVPLDDSPGISTGTIAALLNSRILDQVFRCINGSVAVSAYELEALPLPDPGALMKIEKMIARQASREDIEKEIERIYVEETGLAAHILFLPVDRF